MNKIRNALTGGDLRSIGRSNEIVSLIKNQKEFDTLFELLFTSDRILVMRAADVIEKVTQTHKEFLAPHKEDIINLCKIAVDKELKWHLALLVPRLILHSSELNQVWQMLSDWAMNKKESKIVRVNSIQGLFELLQIKKELTTEFSQILNQIEMEKIPSLTARIKKLRNIK